MIQVRIFQIVLFSLISFYSLAQANCILRVVDLNGNPINDVSIYAKNKFMTSTDINGKFNNDCTNNYQVILTKAGYIEKQVDVRNLDEIILSEIGVNELDAIEIINLNALHELKVLIDSTSSYLLYPRAQSRSIENSLISKNDTLHYLKNNFFFKEKEGLFIENNKNVRSNFQSFNVENSYLNVYELDDDKFALPIEYAARQISIRNVKPLIALKENVEDYLFYFSKNRDTVAMTFEPKNSKNLLYEGVIVYDINDHGIYEMEFKSRGSEKFNTYIFEEKKTKRSFESTGEYLLFANNKKENGSYQFLGSRYEILLKMTKGPSKGRTIIHSFKNSSIENLSSDSRLKFNSIDYTFQ